MALSRANDLFICPNICSPVTRRASRVDRGENYPESVPAVGEPVAGGVGRRGTAIVKHAGLLAHSTEGAALAFLVATGHRAMPTWRGGPRARSGHADQAPG